MNYNVIGIGEVLWDLLPAGRQLGGAPGNFAWHAHALGASVQIISRVGDDENGREIRHRFAAMGLDQCPLQVDPIAPTGTVAVRLAGNGLPEFTIRENVAWDCLAAVPAGLAAAREANAICFGSLAQRSRTSRAAIQAVVSATPPGALRIFDVNLRQYFYNPEIIEHSLQLANVLKLNDGELPILSAILRLNGNPQRQIVELARIFGLKIVALTRGAAGSLLYQEGRWSECVPRPVDVKDTVGAGDAFTAALAVGVLAGMDLDEINRAANEIARFVCSCHGATPPLPEHLCELFCAAKV